MSHESEIRNVKRETRNSELPGRVRIVEVGPRDGLQNEKRSVPVQTKVDFIDRLSASGLTELEVTSFVSPKAVPQLSDATEVLRLMEKRAGVRYSVLVPNLKGLERWLECAEWLPSSSRAIALFTAASETFNRRNINAGVVESLENFRQVIDRLRSECGREIPHLRGYVSTAFVCPYEGAIDPSSVESVCERLIQLGVDELSLGDTIGAATPRQVAGLLDGLIPRFGPEMLALHFHDTRGTALANVLAAMQMSISTFDSAAGGLGGCPFAPGAAGNLATEDLIFMLHGMDISTGVNLEGIVEASTIIAPAVGHDLPSKELQAFVSAGF